MSGLNLHDLQKLPGHGQVSWSEQDLVDIEAIVERYPERKAAIMPVLWKAQRKWGWLSLDVQRLVARTLGLPPSHVLAVATFYTMFKKAPTGRWLLQVCHTLSCELAGADRIIEHLRRRLQLDDQGNSADGKFTLMRVECLAACGSAPMMQVNDDFYELLTPERLDQILDALAADAPLPTPRPEVDRWVYPTTPAS